MALKLSICRTALVVFLIASSDEVSDIVIKIIFSSASQLLHRFIPACLLLPTCHPPPPYTKWCCFCVPMKSTRELEGIGRNGFVPPFLKCSPIPSVYFSGLPPYPHPLASPGSGVFLYRFFFYQTSIMFRLL